MRPISFTIIPTICIIKLTRYSIAESTFIFTISQVNERYAPRPVSFCILSAIDCDIFQTFFKNKICKRREKSDPKKLNQDEFLKQFHVKIDDKPRRAVK